MLRYKTLKYLVAALLVFICSCESGTQNDQPQKTKNEPVKTENQFTGIIQSAGLSKDEMQKIGDRDILFQLVGAENYFLFTDQPLDEFWGQCVAVEGNIIEPKDTEAVLYGRKILHLISMPEAFSGECIYGENIAELPDGETETFEGTIQRAKRPAPDISYDHKLVLNKPYIEKNSAFGDNYMVKEIYLSHIKNDFYKALEEAVTSAEAVKIHGVRTLGYAEEIVLAVKGISYKN